MFIPCGIHVNSIWIPLETQLKVKFSSQVDNFNLIQKFELISQTTKTFITHTDLQIRGLLHPQHQYLQTLGHIYLQYRHFDHLVVF